MLQNEYLVAKIGFDTEENELSNENLLAKFGFDTAENESYNFVTSS